MKTIAVILFSLLLFSCSTIPLSTLVKLACMDETNLTGIKPEQIKTRITVDEPAELQIRNVRLVLKFEFSGGDEKNYQFVLNLIDSRDIKVEKGWFSNSLMRHQYEFELNKNSLVEFKKYQREFLKYGKPERYYWTVYYYLKRRPEKGVDVDLDLELKLAERDGYFFLLKGASLGVDGE